MGHSSPSDLHIAITVDVDADANRPVPGHSAACTAGCDKPVYEACMRGCGAVLDALDERELPATFFWTGMGLFNTDPDMLVRTTEHPRLEHGCHGLHHEDFAGKVIGRPLDEEETRLVLGEATEILTGLGQVTLRGFRAPYCRLTPELRTVLPELGYTYDASLTVEADGPEALRPRPLDGAGGMAELPLSRARDAHGRAISGYLWQLFEGNRPPEDYVDMARRVAAVCPGGLLQIALHPWHLYVDRNNAPRQAGPDLLARVLDGLVALESVRFATVGAYLDASGFRAEA